MESISSMFVTVFYGILNTFTGEIEYVNAGHNPPYVITSSNVHILELTGGIALGVKENISLNSKTIKMHPGEKLFLYTDGVTEAFNEEMTAYGTERLETFLNVRSSQPIESIVKEST